MGEMVIVAYRPKPGRVHYLIALTREHVTFLRELGLATDRPALVTRGEGGVVVEVVEWAPGAVEKAHEAPEVQILWERYAAV